MLHLVVNKIPFSFCTLGVVGHSRPSKTILNSVILIV